jgi:hypothetical protein
VYLIYFDESGNTGNNLNDPQQPVFVLCALAVPESKWLQVELDLVAEIEKLFPAPRSDDFEIHATDLMNGKRWFNSKTMEERISFRDAWLSVAAKHELTIIYQATIKKNFERWQHQACGSGIIINPHVVAFPVVARIVDDWLKSLPESPLGIFISDENKEIVRDVEKSIKVLRGIEGPMKLGQIIEKGFFIDSSKSVILQLCDLCAYTLRKNFEANAGFRDNPLHHGGMALLNPLIHRENKNVQDMLQWVANEKKKDRRLVLEFDLSDINLDFLQVDSKEKLP